MDDETQHGMSEADRKVLSDVNIYGWHVALILGGTATPGWAFSIGMYRTLTSPEIVVFGLNRDVSHWVINEIGARARNGEVPELDAQWEGLLEGVSCTFKPIERVWYEPLLGWARWFYKGDEFPALQCIWPDKSNHWPWSEDFQSDAFWLQPLLFHRDAQGARMERILATLEEGPRGTV